MAHVKQIFLSTVTQEFKHYRDELRGQLTRFNVSVAVQEDFIASGGTMLLKLDDYIQHCDAVIHLLGDATGALPENLAVADLCRRYADLADRLPALRAVLDAPAPALSYTQWEAYLAIYHRKPLFIAMPAPGAVREPDFVIDAGQQVQQQAHRDRLRTLGRYPEITFAKVEDLAIQLLRSALLEILAPGSSRQPIVLPYPTLGTLFKGRDEFLDRLHRQLQQTPPVMPPPLSGGRCMGWAAWARPGWRSNMPGGTVGITARCCSSPPAPRKVWTRIWQRWSDRKRWICRSRKSLNRRCRWPRCCAGCSRIRIGC